MKRKLKITVTKIHRQRLTIKPTFFRAVCPVCGQEVEMLSCAESIEILEIESPMLDALIAAGEVHTTETGSGNRRVCKKSLFR